MKYTFQRRHANVGLILLGLVLSACTQSPQVRSAKYVAAGKQLLRKHDISRAILQFRNAVKATPGDADVYYQLGEAYTASKDIMAALGSYQKALSLDSKHAGARLRLAEIMSVSGDPDAVKDAVTRLDELLKDAEATPEMLNTLAYAELRLGNTQGATETLHRVLTKSPGELGASALLAGASLLNQDTKKAEEILLKVCSEQPRSTEAHRLLGSFYIDQKRPAEAEAQFQAALAIDPNNGPALMELAKLQVSQKRNDEADATLQRLAKLDGYHAVHAVFLFQQGRREESIRELETLTKQNPDDRTMRSDLVVAYRASGRAADADRILAQALKVNPKDTDALLQRGEIAIGMKNYALAESDLNLVLSIRQVDPEVHYLLAKLNEAKGAPLTYRQELFEALRLNPNLLVVRLELARSLTETKPGARTALDLLDTAPASQRDSLPVIVQRNWALWRLEEWAAMKEGIDRGLAQGRSTDLLIQFGLWKLNAGDSAGAKGLIEEALRLDPTDLRAVQALSKTYLAQKDSAMALKAGQQYASEQPKSAAAQDFLGMIFMAARDLKSARKAFEAERKADPASVSADLRLTQVDVAENNFQDARTRLQSVLGTNENNETARLWLGNIEEVLGHHDSAIEHFRKVVASDPENAQASNNLAYLLSEYANKPDEALKYAEKAVNLSPQKAIYADTLGWTLYRKGLYSPAIPYLERAAADKAGDVAWKYHLAMAYAKSGDINRGKVALANALKTNPNVPEAKTAKELLGEDR